MTFGIIALVLALVALLAVSWQSRKAVAARGSSRPSIPPPRNGGRTAAGGKA